MSSSRVELLLMFLILLSEGSTKPGAVRDSSPVFVSSYAKVSRSGSAAAEVHGDNKSMNATVLEESPSVFKGDNCCGGDFKPSALIFVSEADQETKNATKTEPEISYTELPNTDENEESRGYRTYPSRLLQPPVASGHHHSFESPPDSVNPPVHAEDRYAAKSIIKSKPNKVVKMTRQRPSRIPYKADFSDTLNSYQAPLPSKPYPADGPPTSYNPGPPKTSYNPGPPSTNYGSPSLDFLDSPNKDAQRIPYAPDYISSQEGQNQVPDSKMPPSNMPMQPDYQEPAQESHRPMEAATAHPAGSDYNYNPEGYPQYPSEVMTPPKQNPNPYEHDPDEYLPTPPDMKKPVKHKPKPTHPLSYHDDGEMSFHPPEKLHPENPKIPHYPPESGKINPYMHSPGPQWIYKPETNEYSYPPDDIERPKANKEKPGKEKPAFDGIEYIDDEEFPHYLHHHGHHSHHHHHHKEKPMKTTEKPMEDHESEDRQKKPYSYYYLGRKLWFIPLYFSVYFIIYVTALILKSIARHKISYPSLTEEGKKEDRSGRNLHLDDTTDAVYRGIDNTRSKYSNVQ